MPVRQGECQAVVAFDDHRQFDDNMSLCNELHVELGLSGDPVSIKATPPSARRRTPSAVGVRGRTDWVEEGAGR